MKHSSRAKGQGELFSENFGRIQNIQVHRAAASGHEAGSYQNSPVRCIQFHECFLDNLKSGLQGARVRL